MRHPERLRDRDWMAKAYAKGSTNSIAAETGYTPTQVRKWLHKHRIPVRPSTGNSLLSYSLRARA
jgi:hypothetical protein